MTTLKLTNILALTGTIELLSGLHIGSGDGGLRIGGTDSPVVKNPHTNLPFIPGSSLKGKMRSLLEWYIGSVGVSGEHTLSANDIDKIADPAQKMDAINLLKLFGISADSDSTELLGGVGLTRLVVSDCQLDKKYVDFIKTNDLPMTEVKFENSINRISGTAISPRNFERVPAGAKFRFSLTLKEFSCDDAEALKDMLIKGLKLLELDALGGSGSRGYGKIKFILDNPDLQEKLDTVQPFTSVA
jgi:CRISPR-associated protein Csm3